MTDQRSELAKARDDWMDSREGRTCQDGEANGQYLSNRLERAFLAGWNARASGALQIIGMSENDFRRIIRDEVCAAKYPPPAGLTG